MLRLYLDDNGKRKMVGYLQWEGAWFFIKEIYGSKHFLRKPVTAIAYNEAVINWCKEKNVTQLKVIDKETNREYQIAFHLFLESCKYTDRGHGLQQWLALKEWARIK